MRFAIALAFALLTGIAAAQTTTTLEERMSKSDFHTTGLDKLSPAELKALNDWLAGHQPTTVVTKVVTETGKPAFYVDQDRQPVETRIDGKFSGWYGKTIFRLENGQEWTQTESGSFSNGKYDHPKVRIKPMMLGSWLMYIEPCGCSVRVERTK
jgi:hypothetical protein